MISTRQSALRLIGAACTLAPPALVLLRSLRAVWRLPRSYPDAWRVELLALVGVALVLACVAAAVELAAWRAGRARGGALAPLLRLACLAVGVWLLVIFTQVGPFEPWRVDLALGSLLALHALALLADPLFARLSPRARRVLWLVSLQLAATAVLAEVGLRLLAGVSDLRILQRDLQVPSEVVQRERPAPFSDFGNWSLNSRGLNDEEFGPRTPGRGRVLAIGDSFGMGVVPHSHHYTTVAERELGDVEILNLGVPCIGPHEYRYLLESEGLALEPDLVVVTFFVGNDVVDAHLRDQGTSQLQRVLDAGNCLIALVPQRLLRLRGSQLQQVEVSGGPYVVQSIEESEARCPWLVDPMLEWGAFSDETYRLIEADRLHILQDFEERRFAQAFEQIVAMRDAARPVPLAVVLLPDEFQVDDAVWNQARADLGREDFERDRAQRILTRLCAEADIPVLDVLAPLRAAEPLADGKLHVYRLRDTHLNARGNAIVGRELARFTAQLLEPGRARD